MANRRSLAVRTAHPRRQTDQPVPRSAQGGSGAKAQTNQSPADTETKSPE